MIFYFSGTGNSRHAALRCGDALGESCLDLAKERRITPTPTYTLSEGECIGFVFPVYAWGPPPVVLDFLRHLPDALLAGRYLFALCTCGDEAGHTMDLFARAVAQKGGELSTGFSLTMPNNYIKMYDVDPPQLETEKLRAADDALTRIGKLLTARESAFEVRVGSWAFLKSKCIHPMFSKHPMEGKNFRATPACTHCGLCERVCNAGIIALVNGVPTWKGTCFQCMACLHRCPQRAVQYGKTDRKGRYIHPDLRPGAK